MADKSVETIELARIKKYYQHSKSSPMRTTWAKDAKKCIEFHYGKQWSRELKEAVEKKGAKAYTLNFIDAVVTDVLSVPSRLNMRIKYDPQNIEQTKTAEVLSNWALAIQTREMFAFKMQKMLQHYLIGALGYMHCDVYHNDDTLKVSFAPLDPKRVFFDTSDISYDLGDQSFIGYEEYISYSKFASEYPDYIKELGIDKQDVEYAIDSNTDIFDKDTWVWGNRIKIVKMYYKKVVTYYKCKVKIDINEEQYILTYLETFNKEIAEKHAVDNKVEELQGTKMFLGIFHDNILLRNYDDNDFPQVPNQRLFPIVPIVFSRDYDNIPRSFVANLLDIQELKNIFISKGVHYNFAQTMFVSDEQLDINQLERRIDSEHGKLNAVIPLTNPDKAQIISHDKTLPFVGQILGLADREAEHISGLEKEFLGGKGGSNTGIGKAKVEQLTMEAQSATINQIEMFLQNIGELLLCSLRGMKDFKLALQVHTMGGEVENNTINELSVLTQLAVNVQRFANVASSYANANQIIISLIGTPLEFLLLSPPMLVNNLGCETRMATEASANYIQAKKLEKNGYMTPEEIQQQLLMTQQANNV